MATAERYGDASSVMCIEGEMTIYQAEQQKPALLAALEQVAVLELNLAAVTELDTAGVQLLMLLKETARACGKELRLSAHSEAVLEVFDLIDLAGYFGDPLVTAAHASPAAERVHGS